MGKGKTYNREFQLQTSRLVVEQGYTLKEASDRLERNFSAKALNRKWVGDIQSWYVPQC
jgi:hypothetical protein